MRHILGTEQLVLITVVDSEQSVSVPICHRVDCVEGFFDFVLYPCFEL